MRSYWIKVDPKSNCWHSYKEKAIQRHTKREGHANTKPKIGAVQQRIEKARKDPSPEPSEGG